MIRHRKQWIAGAVTVAVGAPAIVALFGYLFAVGSPSAVPLLLTTMGFIIGYLSVYSVARFFGRGGSFVGRLVRGATLAVICVAGFAMSAMLPFDGTMFELFLKGLGSGASLVAFLNLFFGFLLPPNPSGWIR